MKRMLPAAVATLALWGCGDSNHAIVNDSREVMDASQQSVIASRAMGLVASSDASEKFVTRTVFVDDTGAEHVRFDRTLGGLRVLGGDVVVHNRGAGLASDVTWASDVSLKGLSTKPVLDAAAATTYAEKAFVGKRSGPSSAELMVDARPDLKPAVSYEVVLEGVRPDGTPSELHVLVDARTGELRGSWEGVETTAAVGTGKSINSGTVSIGTNTISGGYEMRDVTRGNGFYTMNYATGLVFTDADNVWGNGATSDAASSGVDAHYGQQVTYDYYKNVHNRNGIDNAGNTGYSRVHYGTKYNNAFWQDSCFCMTYGDGDGTTFRPLTALDVAGHEMSHGVTSRTAGLVYSGESGGLNEATSDIFGSMVEFYANNANDPGDYLIGEVIYTPNKAGDALRYMYKPNTDGSSANCWSSTVGSLDVHYSSGVANHFFYLLAEGSAGNPVSPTCNGLAVAGIGRDAAAKIWYRALTVYMTSSTNYKAARTATLNAAKDLYGNPSTQYTAVGAAWTAVSVN
ncbi:peptidase M4 family protein [Corallococcus sp. H22C18031201]|nr:peptidase M4 family protein [Corallococcus sp. H22C18031201]